MENELLPEYNRGTRRRSNPEYVEYTSRIIAAKKEGDWKLAKELEKQRRTVPSQDPYDPDYRRLRYVRYADDFLNGFAGPRKEAEEIKERTGEFLKTIRLDMSEEKTLITHAATERARFLNYQIKVATPTVRRGVSYQIQLLVPPDVKTKWRQKYTKQGKPHHRAEMLEMSDFEIIQTYGAEFRGIVNYYKLAVNVSKVLYPVKYVAIASAVKTLAAKHKTKATRIYRKYCTTSEHGVKALIVEAPNPNNPDKPYKAQLGERPIKYTKQAVIVDKVWKPYFPRTELVDRLLADVCELCDSQVDVQIHHINKLADLKKLDGGREKPQWVRFMIERRRKTIAVCRDCHQAIHAGTYDGQPIRNRV